MKKHQFKELLTNNQVSSPIRITRTVGKNKGKIGTFASAYGAALTALFGGVKDEGHCSKYELVDEFGEMILSPITDMTDRPILAGDYIVYSVPAGNSSSALEMGKVEKFGPVGSPMVKRIMQNGSKITRGGDKLKTITDANRCIKLPIEATTMVMWRLKDFKDMSEE